GQSTLKTSHSGEPATSMVSTRYLYHQMLPSSKGIPTPRTFGTPHEEVAMRAWTAIGDDRTIAVTEVPEPVPAAGRAVVEVAAYPVNRGESLSLTGAYGEPAAAGTVPGRDVTGTVVAAATDGTGPAVGTTVVAFAPGGAWAERAAVPSDATVPL